jgi:hypothetical protein
MSRARPSYAATTVRGSRRARTSGDGAGASGVDAGGDPRPRTGSIAIATVVASAEASASHLSILSSSSRTTLRTATRQSVDEESFRHQVAARLGYQPFTRDGKHRVSRTLTAARGRVRVRAEVTRSGPTAQLTSCAVASRNVPPRKPSTASWRTTGLLPQRDTRAFYHPRAVPRTAAIQGVAFIR